MVKVRGGKEEKRDRQTRERRGGKGKEAERGIRGGIKGDTVKPSTENVAVRELLVYNQSICLTQSFWKPRACFEL